MGNEIYHNKWHAFNHFTVPLEGFPDSATDPIASRETPFLGVFYNSLSSTLSGTPKSYGSSDSMGWWFYSSTTIANSSYWQLYPTVLNTTITLSSDWNLGFEGYTTLFSASARYDSLYNTTSSLSGADQYETLGGITGPGGVGWHIALSATTHRLNEDQANTHQKVARPVQLFETGYRNVVWNLSAQTVYVQLTGNYALSASQVQNLKKGGKYTMWVYIDRCPEENMDFIFDPLFYNIAVKELSSNDYFQSNTNVIRLSASSITRIDFTCNGKKLLGKATHYSIWVPTEKDLYFKGVGLKMVDPNTLRNRSPVYASTNRVGSNAIIGTPAELANEGYWLVGSEGINIIENYLSFFTFTSSIYVDGPPLSGIRMRYLNANSHYVSFIVNNANWPSLKQITVNRSLTGSFDRIVGTLSSNGDFKNPIYADNLICSPGYETITNPIQELAFPIPPYDLVQSNIKEVKLCTSAYEVQIYSGKDRDIDLVFLNGRGIEITPVKNNGDNQPYNFLNERTCSITLNRVQEDNLIEAYFKPQLPTLLPNNVLWFNSLDSSLINSEAGPILDFYISWNLGTTTVTAYQPGDPVIQNEYDRPRINTFRSDSNFIKYLSAGFEVLCGSNKFYPWDDRLSGYEVVSIPVPGTLSAGVDLFTANYLPPTYITPSIGNWNIDSSNQDELKYQFIKKPTDYKTPTTLISLGIGANVEEWPSGSYPTIKTWETTNATASLRPLTAFYSNTLDNKKLFQYNISNAPNILTTNTLRSIELLNGKFMTLNCQLTTLNGGGFFKPFTTFTVISTSNITNTFSNSSIIWWLGDFYTGDFARGYGLMLKGNRLYNTANQTRAVGTLSSNNLYIISTVYGSNNSNRVLVNNSSTFNSRLTRVLPASSFNFILGKNPESNSMYCSGMRLFDFYLFDRAFTRGDLLQMNTYLLDKFNTFN